MSSLALMRLLESAPGRYDAGMRLVTLGRVTEIHEAAAAAAAPTSGHQVLEIGCGTGALTERLVARGARVTALDQSPEMLEQARARLGTSPVTWLERTASEIDTLPPTSFDAVVSSFVFSEMSPSERSFVLRSAAERLRPEGLLVLADEVRPEAGGSRVLFALLRAPQAAVGWLVAGEVSKPVPDLRSEIESAGLTVRTERRWLGGTLALFVAGHGG